MVILDSKQEIGVGSQMIVLTGDEKLNMDNLISLIGKILAIIYVRVSTTDQAEKGYSLESQIERCKERALTKFDIKEDEIVVLIEAGGMGDDPNRPALNYALYLLEKGLGKKFIVLHPDRLSRDNTLQGVVSRKIWNLGVDIEFVEFEVDPTNPESMLMYNIQGSIAQYNKAKIVANSKRGRIQKAQKGEIPSFNRLYGYKYNKETDKLEINEEEKEIILEMIDMLLNQDKSCNQIAKELSLKGYPAPKGKIWYQTTVTRILRNEDYLGIFYHGRTQVVQSQGKKKQVPRPREEWIEIPIDQIIDEHTFNLVQEKIDSFNKGKGRKSKSYLLKGIVRCGRCGSSAGSGITSKVKAGVYKYYACRRKANKAYHVGSGDKKDKCMGRNWRVDIVDELVWENVVKAIESPELINAMLDIEESDEQINILLKKEERHQKQLEDLAAEEEKYIHLFGKGKIKEGQFDAFVKPIQISVEVLTGELELIRKEINSLKRIGKSDKKLNDYQDRLKKIIKNDSMPMTEKRRIAKYLIEKVILNEDGAIEIYWGFNNVIKSN